MGVTLTPDVDLIISSLLDGTLESSVIGESIVVARGRLKCCIDVASDLDRGRILSKNCFILFVEEPPP